MTNESQESDHHLPHVIQDEDDKPQVGREAIIAGLIVMLAAVVLLVRLL